MTCHGRPDGRCLRCAWGAGKPGGIIASVDDPRLRSVQSVAGKHVSLHWVFAAAFIELNAARLAEGLPAFEAASGHRVRRWPTKRAYHDALVRKYAHRLPAGSSRRKIIAYGKRWLAWESLHFSALALDMGNNGLVPRSKSAKKQRKSEGYLWLVEYAAREELGGRLVNYPAEPWHWEYFIDRGVWALQGPEG